MPPMWMFKEKWKSKNLLNKSSCFEHYFCGIAIYFWIFLLFISLGKLLLKRRRQNKENVEGAEGNVVGMNEDGEEVLQMLFRLVSFCKMPCLLVVLK